MSPAPSPPPSPASSPVTELEPVGTLLQRARRELSHDFGADRPVRLSRAPARLDVMGGIAEYTGSLVCQMPLAHAAAVALSRRSDRDVQVFSFDLFDRQQPFTLRIPLDALASASPESLRNDLAAAGRGWAGAFLGCLFVLHERGLVDLRNPSLQGLNLALLCDIPAGAGVGSTPAIGVAAMVNLLDHFDLRDRVEPMQAVAMCHEMLGRILGAPHGIKDVAACCLGRPDTLLRMVCQPGELGPDLPLPPKIRVVGIFSGVRRADAAQRFRRTRCAAFMGHAIILDKMRQMATAKGGSLADDPMRGRLANLDQNDFKLLFRPYLPEAMPGSAFIARHGATVDPGCAIEPDVEYRIQQAVDHHVLEARRVRQFVAFLEEASRHAPGSRPRMLALDKAGHLMYASHIAGTNDALLGCDECDLLVKLVRDREREGFYGARMTGAGCGGTVAILCNQSPRTDAALQQILDDYKRLAGRNPQLFADSTPGAWHAGTRLA